MFLNPTLVLEPCIVNIKALKHEHYNVSKVCNEKNNGENY